MKKRMIIMLVAAFVVFGGIFGWKAFMGYMMGQFMAKMALPPQTISAIPAASEDWQPHQDSVGSLRAVNGADLAPQVAGIVSAIHFESGADVKQGALLVELSAADDVAKLDSAKASAALAKVTYDRALQQLKIRGVSQQTVDANLQALKSAEAAVAEQQAVVDHKFIRAPFEGRAGIRQVDVGQYINAGTVVVTLQSLDPIFVDFYLPQQSLAHLKPGQPVKLRVDTYPDQEFNGAITAINPKVDPDSRNVQIRATLKNPDGKLVPGMFANVVIDTGMPERHITLPQTAITYNPYGSTVFVVDDKGAGPDGKKMLTARQVVVTTGPTRGDQVAVLTGLKEGETVVTAGQLKLRNGMPVNIDNSIPMPSNPNPSPAER